jgi:predicted transcriptional regulator
VVKNWRENSNSVKAKTSSMKTSNLQATIIVDGDATELKGNLAKKAIRLVEKNKTDVNLPDNQELKETV